MCKKLIASLLVLVMVCSGMSMTAFAVTTEDTGNGEPTPVWIKSQPSAVTVAEGEMAQVSFEAVGDELTYQWYYKNAWESKFLLTATFTTNTYETQMNLSRDGRQIYCVVTDKYGNSVTTDTVSINMTKVESELEITKQPESVSVGEGADAVVTFEATGEGLTYQWYYKNAWETKFTLTKTFTGNTYTTQMNLSRDGRQVYCVVTDKYGNSVTTDTATIRMTKVESDLEITTQPVSVTVEEGAVAEVAFEAKGEGLTYQWYYKNAWETSFTMTTAFTGNTYSAQMNAARAGRQLYCVVTDMYGNSVTTNTVTIEMISTDLMLQITQQPTSVTAAEGEQAAVSLTAVGNGLSYKWYYKNAWETKFTLTTSFTGNTYAVEMNANRNGRQVYCVISDRYGSTVTTDTVTLAMAEADAALQITRQPVSVTVLENQQATVSFAAIGNGLTYQWFYKNAWETKFSATASFTGDTYAVEMNSTRNGRQVYCVVTDENGETVTTDTVSLNLLATDLELKITRQPVHTLGLEGENVAVDFGVQGSGLTFKWYYKNAGASSFTATSTFAGNTYTTQLNGDRHGRQIYCVVTDKNGNTAKTDTVYLIRTENTWLVPVEYERLSSPFGMREHPIYGAQITHGGVDLAAKAGVPVYATRSGVVVYAEYYGGNGNYVFLDHMDGYQSSYLHMQKYVVKPGQVVSAGQLVGYVGSTGASTGPHLHFGVKYNGAYVDPENYMVLPENGNIPKT